MRKRPISVQPNGFGAEGTEGDLGHGPRVAPDRAIRGRTMVNARAANSRPAKVEQQRIASEERVIRATIEAKLESKRLDHEHTHDWWAFLFGSVAVAVGVALFVTGHGEVGGLLVIGGITRWQNADRKRRERRSIPPAEEP
jgi:hypothetical protein